MIAEDHSTEENTSLPEETVDTAPVLDESAEGSPAQEPSVVSVESETVAEGGETSEPASVEEAPLAEPASPAEPVAPPVEESRASSADPAPGYGAPQMLYEDFIPYEFLHDVPPATPNETPAEPEPAPEPEKKKKKDKKQAEAEAEELLAAVEAELAARAETPPEVPVAPVVTPPVVPETQPAHAEPVAPQATEPEEAENMAEETREPVTREYTPYEKKLRRKYRLDKDALLSANDVVPGFVLAKGENVVRCYSCLNSEKGTGTICLTNKRLLINADERSEVSVSEVSGIKFSKNAYFSVAKFLFALIFSLLAAFMVALPFIHESVQIPFLAGENWKDWFMYLFIACGAVSLVISLPLWIKMVKKQFYFNIFVKDSTPFLECKSSAFVKQEKKGRAYSFLVSDAGKESEKAARELGALIIEVKAGRYDF